jgi:hypothetical protein
MTHRRISTSKTAVLALAGAALTAGLAVPLGAQAATAGPDVGMDNLLHPVDIAETLVVPGTVTSRVGAGDGSLGLSACTGEARMRHVVGPQANRYFGLFTGRVGQSGEKVSVVQHAADEPTVTEVRGKYRKIVGMLTTCQQEPSGHWRYGRAHHVTTGSGTATWMVARNGDGTRAGGVVVARSARHLGVVAADCPCSAPQIKELATRTLRRLR